MKQIWAPWRMEYIRKADRPGCFLCAMFAEHKDRENRLLLRGRACALVMNIYPYNNGHLMVAPYRHVADLAAMTAGERAEMMEISTRACLALRRVMNPDGFNVGLNIGKAAGAGLKDHIHLHIVPRWEGDTNFMPALAGVKVIPQSLDQTYDLLCSALKEGRRLPSDDQSQGFRRRKPIRR